MQNFKTKTPDKDIWPVKAATIVTSSQQNLTILMKEFLRTIHWTLAHTTPSVQSALDQIHRGLASLIIVDDNPDLPASLVQRYLLRDPVGCITPCIVLMTPQNRAERPAISALGNPFVVEKPVTPNRFMPALRTVLKVWSEGPFVEIRLAAEALIKGQEETGLKLLTKLAAQESARTLIAPSLSYYFNQNGNVKTAEKILLTALKSAPRSLGLILSLCDLYFHTAMPRMAQRLLKSAEIAYGDILAIQPDKFQAEMMLQNLSGMASVLNTFNEREYFPDEYKTFLARVLFSEGHINDFHKLIPNADKVRDFHEAWEPVTDKNTSAA